MRPVVFILFSLLITPAHAAEAPKYLAPFALNAHYQFEFMSIPFGEMGVAIEQDAQSFAMTIDVRSAGVARVFVKHDSHSVASGEGSQFRYPTRRYESNYQTRDKRKDVFMRYEKGVQVENVLQPPINTKSRDVVSAEMLKDSYDPLFAIIMLRQRLFETLQSGKSEFEVKVYDGRRLTRGVFHLNGTDRIYYEGRKVPVYHVTASREALAGYTDKEIQRMAKDEPTLHLYFTQDTHLLPILLDAPVGIGTVKARLEDQCVKPSDCLLGITLP